MVKKKLDKLSKVKKICYDNIEYCKECIKIFQNYLDEYHNKYGDKPDSYTRFAIMLIDAYKSNITTSGIILLEIDSSFKKKLI